MTWHDAMERFGTDKPDVRFGMELVELTGVFAGDGVQGLQGRRASRGCGCRAAPPSPAGSSTTSPTRAKSWGAEGLVWMRVEADGTPELAGGQVPLARRSWRAWRRRWRPSRATACSSWPPPLRVTRHVLGLLRLELGRPPVNEGGRHFLWVVDFPLFEGVDDEGRPIPAHHPFTMPHVDDLAAARAPPNPTSCSTCAPRPTTWCSTAGSWARAASGSTAATSSSGSSRLLGIGEEEAQRKFGFLLDAFRYGAPPHAGFAFGDRPAGRAARRRGEHPRGHRLPEDPVGRRPAHRRPRPDRRRPADRARPPGAAAEGLNWPLSPR